VHEEDPDARAEYERGMDPEYLHKLKDAYNAFFYRYSETPLLVVNTDESIS